MLLPDRGPPPGAKTDDNDDDGGLIDDEKVMADVGLERIRGA